MRVAKVMIGLAGLCGAVPAGAQELKGVAFAGGAVGDGASAYAGTVVSLPGARLGRGLALRGSVNGGQYRYDINGVRIEADYIGAEGALVYQSSGDWGWANFSAGPRVTETSLSPDDPANERRGTRFDFGLQSDGALQLDSDWRLNWLGAIGVIDGPYQARLALGRLVDRERQTRLGVETALQGDPRFTTLSGGVFAATQLGRNFEGQISGGVTDQEGLPLRPYGTIGLSVLF